MMELRMNLETGVGREKQGRGLGRETVVVFLVKESDTQLIASPQYSGNSKSFLNG